MFETNFLGSNINRVKAHNLQAVLLSLLYEEQISRVQLAQRTSLSSTTITNLVGELIEQGIVVEDCASAEEEQRSVGRPRTGLCLDPDARYAVGVNIEVGLFRVAVVNLRAELVSNEIVEFSVDRPAEEVLKLISQKILQVIAKAGEQTGVSLQKNKQSIVGVGVGASGLVNYPQGINILAPRLGWHEVPVRDFLQAELGIPVVVDNNVRAMALAEAYFGCGRQVQSLAFVYGRLGVGAGFVVEGQVYRGSSTGAGEIGHMIIVPENGLPCRCGKNGCLETLVSASAIFQQAEAAARENPEGILAKMIARANGQPSVDMVFQAARQGDRGALDLLERTSYYLGIALANLVNILNPEMIVLGGIFAQGSDLILSPLSRTIRSVAFANLGEKVRLVTTPFGWRAGVTGAAALALLRFFYQQTSITIPAQVNGSL